MSYLPDQVCAVYGIKRDELLRSQRGRFNEPRNVAIHSSQSVQKYLESKFGDVLEDVSNAMLELAKSLPTPKLAEKAYGLYEKFRPEIPAGMKGWGPPASWTWTSSAKRLWPEEPLFNSPNIGQKRWANHAGGTDNPYGFFSLSLPRIASIIFPCSKQWTEGWFPWARNEPCKLRRWCWVPDYLHSEGVDFFRMV